MPFAIAELSVCGSSAYKREDYLAAVEVKTGRINLDGTATCESALDEFVQAYDVGKSGVGLKVMLKQWK